MALETILGISLLAAVFIGYAISQLPRKPRFKYVNQKVKDRSKDAYTVVLYI